MPQTGPRTPQGKARSSRNATRHGLYSRALVAGDETLEQWHDFRDGVVASLRPRGPAEADLARRIAVLIWLLRRVARAESEIASRDPAALTTADGRSLDVIARREATLSRQLHRAFLHLDALRAARDPLSLLDRLREKTGK